MPGSNGPNLGLTYGYSAHEAGWGLGGFNPDMAQLDTLVMLTVISTTILTPPGSPADGDRYIINGTGVGAWTGHDHAIAVWVASATAWVFYVPKNGWVGYSLAASEDYRFNGTTWVPVSGSGQSLENLSDVEISGQSNGQVVTWNSSDSKWENADPTGGALTALTDVEITSPSNGQVLTYNLGATKWENEAIPAPSLTIEQLTDVQVTSIGDGQVLAWSSGASKWENVDQSGGGGAITDKGAWSGFTSYSPGDVAIDSGVAYLCFNSISAPAGSLSIEGATATGGFNSLSSSTVTITTTGTDQIIVVLVGAADGTSSAGNSVSSVTSSHLTFTKRHGENITGSFYSTDLEIWWAHSTAPLTGEVITVDFSFGSTYGSLAAIAVTGASSVTPFDANGSLPATAHQLSAGTGSATYSTTAGNTLAFFMETTTETNSFGGASANHHPVGFTPLSTEPRLSSGGGQNYSYIINNTVQTGVVVNGADATSDYHVMIDAIAENADGNLHPGDDAAHWLPAQVVFTGDSGSGGSIGLVPAPPSGSAADGEFLSANGSFAIPGGTTFIVSSLPAAGVLGRRAIVTDGNSPTFLGTATGGGGVTCPVFDNGTAWVFG